MVVSVAGCPWGETMKPAAETWEGVGAQVQTAASFLSVRVVPWDNAGFTFPSHHPPLPCPDARRWAI